MKIYTGKGDGGQTSLFEGTRVFKDHALIETYGAVDELNSFVGALSASIPDDGCIPRRDLDLIQSDLILLNAWLTVNPKSRQASKLASFGQEKITYLEGAIDRLQKRLPDLKGFLLPGGHISAAWAHVARSVCRRAERRLVRLIREPSAEVPGESPRLFQVYLNRLSDYLFVLARWCNFQHGMSDTVFDK